MIYFIQAVQGGPIKIGHTNQPIKSRLTDIQRMCPIPLQVIGAMDGDKALESNLHFRFRQYRLHGEWFEPVGAILNLIQEQGQAYPEMLHRLHDSSKRTCQGARFNGEPCGSPAVVGTDYCQHHQDFLDRLPRIERRKCSGERFYGREKAPRPCRNFACEGSDLCNWHLARQTDSPLRDL